jgi:hypothetical protein
VQEKITEIYSPLKKLSTKFVVEPRKLKDKQTIDHSWTTIVETMKSMQSSVTTVNNDKNKKITSNFAQDRPKHKKKSLMR